jgi:hypothetical protein
MGVPQTGEFWWGSGVLAGSAPMPRKGRVEVGVVKGLTGHDAGSPFHVGARLWSGHAEVSSALLSISGLPVRHPEQPATFTNTIAEGGATMRLMIMIKATQASEAGVMPSEPWLTEMGQFNDKLVQAGAMLAGEGLHPSSRGARVRLAGDQRTVTDGPIAETQEVIAGCWLWQVASKAEAITWVTQCPNPHGGDCEIEIRQVFDAEDFGAALTPELRAQEARRRAVRSTAAVTRCWHRL